MSRTGLASTWAVDVNLATIQRGTDGPAVGISYKEVAVIRPLQFEDLTKRNIKQWRNILSAISS